MSKEIENKALNESGIFLTQFSGGHGRGLCLQITGPSGFAQVDREQAQHLQEALATWLTATSPKKQP